jgi:tetratricopeptide (TPR) repeat protein
MTTNGQTAPATMRNGSEQSKGRTGRDFVALGVPVIVGLVACVAFLPVLGNRFVDQWDDKPNFLANLAFRGLGWPEIRWAWTTMLQGAYQPLAWMLFELEYVAWGLDPRGFHLASMVLHAINAILFYILIRTLVTHARPEIDTGRHWGVPLTSGLAAALFAVHPLRVEVVAWASCQPYLPCAAFAILSVLAYLRGFGQGRRRLGWVFAAASLFAAALCCKAVAMGLPLVLLVLDVLVLQRFSTRWSIAVVVAEKFLFLVPAIAFGAIAIKAKSEAPAINDFQPGLTRTVLSHTAEAGYGLGFYLKKTIWPSGLSAFHFRRDPIVPSEPPFAVSLAVVGLLGVIACLLRRRWPSILAAILSYAAILAPNLGIVSYDLMLVADRYSYLATMPLFVLAAGGLVRWVTVSTRPRALTLMIGAIGSGLIAIWVALTWAQCATWRDSETLVAHGLRVGSGRDGLLESNFGVDLLDIGRVGDGMIHLFKAIQIDPKDPDAHENLGIILVKAGKLDGAIIELAEAARLAPSRFDLRHHLGMALAQRGRLDQAAEQLAEAVRLRPDKAQVHISLGGVLAALGRRDLAAAQYAEALQLDPGNPEALRKLDELPSRGNKP